MRALAFMALTLASVFSGAARAEFVVKYHIDGHILAPAGPSAGNASWCADMDGDPTSPEMIAFDVGSDVETEPIWLRLGVAHIASGQTEWLPPEDTGTSPLVAAAYWPTGGLVPQRCNPIFWDVDSDGLLDALVPVMHQDQLMTVVIGWSGSFAAAAQPPTTSSARLLGATPSPSQTAVSFDYVLPQKAEVELSVVDVTGRLIRRVIDQEQDAGHHSAVWDGSSLSGARVETGTYFYSFKVNGIQVAKRSSVVIR